MQKKLPLLPVVKYDGVGPCQIYYQTTTAGTLYKAEYFYIIIELIHQMFHCLFTGSSVKLHISMNRAFFFGTSSSNQGHYFSPFALEFIFFSSLEEDSLPVGDSKISSKTNTLTIMTNPQSLMSATQVVSLLLDEAFN